VRWRSRPAPLAPAPSETECTGDASKNERPDGRQNQHGGRGQPATRLVINPDSCYSIGINVDRDHITLVDSMLAINCLINPEAVLIGGRLPAQLVDQLAAALNRRLQAYSGSFPAIAPVARAAMSDDAPAVGAAILPFSHRLLPTRFALMKTAGGG